MVKIYANRIMTSNGAFTLFDVPFKYRADVEAILIEKGFMAAE